MRFSKRIIGLAVAVAFAAGVATTDRASAGTISGTQIEYVENSSTTATIDWASAMRQFIVILALSHV